MKGFKAVNYISSPLPRLAWRKRCDPRSFWMHSNFIGRGHRREFETLLSRFPEFCCKRTVVDEATEAALPICLSRHTPRPRDLAPI